MPGPGYHSVKSRSLLLIKVLQQHYASCLGEARELLVQLGTTDKEQKCILLSPGARFLNPDHSEPVIGTIPADKQAVRVSSVRIFGYADRLT